ncbi:MAG: hypothetical protein ACM31L_08310 [Actinomycetota bacterium]
MDYLYGIGIALHTIAAVVWVGGMFFAHVVLRPALMDATPAVRLGLWRRVFPLFFSRVWLSILTLLVTGYGVLLTGYRGGVSGGALHVDTMQVTGLTMMALYLYLWFVPYRAFKGAMEIDDLPAAAAAQGRIRQVVTINLILGLFTVFIGAAGTFIGY